jgi:predicted CopG family antitoxin
MTMTKRIPVSEAVWKQLSNSKEAGRTYDDLLREMIQIHNRKKLMEKMESVESMKVEDLVDLDQL